MVTNMICSHLLYYQSKSEYMTIFHFVPKQMGTNEILTIWYQSKQGQIKCWPKQMGTHGILTIWYQSKGEQMAQFNEQINTNAAIIQVKISMSWMVGPVVSHWSRHPSRTAGLWLTRPGPSRRCLPPLFWRWCLHHSSNGSVSVCLGVRVERKGELCQITAIYVGVLIPPSPQAVCR